MRGLLQLAMRSREASKYALSLTQRLVKTIGPQGFYTKLYDKCPEDLQFVQNNAATIQAAADLILSASLQAMRRDVLQSFAPNPALSDMLKERDNVFGLYGENAHGIDVEIIRTAASVYDVPVDLIPAGGRNCAYMRPEVFFALLRTGEDMPSSTLQA